MEQLNEYRQRLVERLEAATREFVAAVQAVARPKSPLEAGGWNAHQIAVHTRDTHALVYGLRIRRTLAEENPLFENFDGEKWMAENYNGDEPLASILDGLTASVRETVASLRGLAPAGWARSSRHATLGEGFAVQTWAERALAHIEEHLASVRRAV